MKKLVLILGLCLMLDANAWAEVYHGIDIDAIYESSDWNSKDDIKQLIDDYTLLLQYQEEFNNCPDLLPDVLDCYDAVAEKIVTNLYVQPEYNVEDYKQLKKALSDDYGLKNCRNKYAWPSGHMCEFDMLSDMRHALATYIQNLIDSCKEKMIKYSSILEKYEKKE